MNLSILTCLHVSTYLLYRSIWQLNLCITFNCTCISSLGSPPGGGYLGTRISVYLLEVFFRDVWAGSKPACVTYPHVPLEAHDDGAIDWDHHCDLEEQGSVFLNNGLTPASIFVYFWSFQTNNTLFTTNQFEKCSSSIRTGFRTHNL